MAKKNTGLGEEELKSILRKAISNSEHYVDGKLATERESVEKYYRGELPEPLHKGDSKYVSRDVFDSVDSMRATVLESFLAHSRIVFFRPEKGETEAAAKQATEYCRHVFFKKNDGETTLYETLTDGLMKRYAVVKVYHETLEEEDDYDFEGLTEDELTMTVSEHDNYEFVEAETSDNGLYSGTFRVKTIKENVRVETVQPEDFMVSSKASSLGAAKYMIHRVTKTASDLKKEGYPQKKIDEINFENNSDINSDYEKERRFDGVGNGHDSDGAYDDASREATLYEVYIHIDMDESGVSKLWKICYASGGVILDKEQISRFPFVSFVPLPIPHTFYGDNYAQSVIPIQNARTILIRQIINHSMVTNNPRHMVLNGTVMSPNELLENRLGGLVNVRRMDGIAPIPQAALNPFVFNLIQMIDDDKEEVTGVSKLSQGMNKDAVSTQNAEGMVEQLISQSQQRQKIVARQFGKFLRELWHLIYATAVDYVDEDEYIEVTGEYTPVVPSDWTHRTAASIELSLGYGEQAAEAAKWAEIDQYFSQDPQLAPMYTMDKRYEVISRGLSKRGIEDIESILTPPEKMQPQEPSEMEVLQKEQLKSQIEYQKAQAQAMTMKAQTDQMKAQTEQLKVQAIIADNRGKQSLSERTFAHEAEIDFEELALAKKTEDTRATFNLSN